MPPLYVQAFCLPPPMWGLWEKEVQSRFANYQLQMV